MSRLFQKYRVRFLAYVLVIAYLLMGAFLTYWFQFASPVLPISLVLAAVTVGISLIILQGQEGLKEQNSRLQEQIRQLQVERLPGGTTRREFVPPPTPPRELAQALAKKNCVIFIGRDFNPLVGLPSWTDLLKELVQEAEEQDPTYGWGDLKNSVSDELSASRLEELLVSRLPRESLISIIRRVFSQPYPPLPTGFRVIKQLPFAGAITTSFDDVLERTLRREEPSILTPADSDAFSRILRQNQFFLLKLNGSITRPDTLTLGDFEHRRTISENPEFSKFVSSIYSRSTLLFVGASMRAIEDFVKAFSLESRTDRKHFALVPSIQTNPLTSLKLADSGIRILPYEPTEGGDEILRFLEELRGSIPFEEYRIRPDRVDLKSSSLQRAILHNIGPFKHIEFDLGSGWNIFLGDNGCGKSTALRGIALGLCGDDDRARRSAPDLLRSGEQSGFIELVIDGASYRTELVREESRVLIRSKQLTPLQSGLSLIIGFPSLRGVSTHGINGPKQEASSGPDVEDVLPLLEGEVDERMDDLKQWITNRWVLAERSKDSVERDTNAKVLKSFSRIVQDLSPGLAFEFSHIDTKSWKVMVRTDDGTIPIDLLSNGMTSLLSWVGVLLQRIYGAYDSTKSLGSQHALLLVDEIDVHLHPRWQRALVPLLKKEFPSLQVIATTHSPLIVGNMSEGEVLLLKRLPETNDIERTKLKSYKSWRADQILTGPPFGMDSSVDVETERLVVEYRSLLGNPKKNERDTKRLQELSELLRKEIPGPEEREARREIRRLFEKWLEEQLKAQDDKSRQRIIAEIDEYFATNSEEA